MGMKRKMSFRRLIGAITLGLVLAMAGTAAAEGQTVSGKAYNRLNEAQKLMSANQVSEAITVLETLLAEVGADTLDRALTLQTLGYAEMSRERFPKAIEYLRASLDTGLLPEKVGWNPPLRQGAFRLYFAGHRIG